MGQRHEQDREIVMRANIVADENNPGMVILVVEGKRICDMPWQVSDQMATAFRQAARIAEERQKANKIIIADAALIRSGAPFALTNNPRIRDEAYKTAQWDSQVRRAMPMRGAPSAKATGTPKIVKSRGILP